MLFAIDPDARVFALDTHVLFPETYAVWREVERRYGTKVEVYEGPTLARQAEIHGEALWERKPDLCCAIRKVEPLEPRARRARRLDHRACAATSRRRARTRRRSAGTKRTSSGRQTRSPTGTTRAAGPTSASAAFPTTSCTTAATPRSAARTARSRARAARAAGRAATRSSAGCTRSLRPTPPPRRRGRGRRSCSGFVVWLTGLSAAGKSTIAGLVAAELEARGVARRPSRRRRRPHAPHARASASRRTTATRTSSGSAGSPRGSPAPARRSSSRRSRPTRRRGRRRARSSRSTRRSSRSTSRPRSPSASAATRRASTRWPMPARSRELHRRLRPLRGAARTRSCASQTEGRTPEESAAVVLAKLEELGLVADRVAA